MPRDVPHELTTVEVAEQQLRLVLVRSRHIEREDVRLQQALPHHVIENRQTHVGHLRIGQADNGIIIFIKDAFLYHQADGLSFNFYCCITETQLEIIDTEVTLELSRAELDDGPVVGAHKGR